MIRPFLPVALACLALAGCGGSSTGNGQFDSIVNTGDRLFDDLENTDFTAFADLPTSGQARFDGSVGYLVGGEGVFDRFDDLDEDTSLSEFQLVSDIDLTVRFGNGTFTGNADNFYSRNGAARGGELSFDGEYNRFSANFTGTHLLGEATGRIFDPSVGVRAVDGIIAADLLGDDAGAIGGAVVGSVGPEANERFFVGVFAAD